jgi:hypothetical protein
MLEVHNKESFGLSRLYTFLNEQASVLVKNFRDKRPITNISDARIQQNHDSMHWFIKWENSVKSDEKIKNKGPRMTELTVLQ